MAENLNSTLKIPKPARMPWVIPVFCDGCASCVNACRPGFLKLTDTNVSGVFVPWLEEPSRCSGCGKCADACAMGGITMTSYVAEAERRFREKRPHLET